MKEVIVRLTSDHIKVKGGEYVQDLVRCKDCEHRTNFYCPHHPTRIDDLDFFCGYGEVRDE